MASPFSIFRRNRKAMLAVLTILTMFGFVFIPIIIEAVGLKGGSGDTETRAVVRTARYGELTNRDIAVMLSNGATLRNIVREIGFAVRLAGGEGRAVQRTLNRLGLVSEDAAVHTWLLAHYAQEMGLVVSDAAINSFIAQLTENKVTYNQLKSLINTKEHRWSDAHFFRVLRDELLAIRAYNLFSTVEMAQTPAQRWNQFCMFQRQAVVEVVPLPVSRYAAEIADPDDAALRKFFEENKDKPAQPDSPEPGLKEPQRFKLRYLKVDFEKFAAEAVSDQEVLEQYEKERAKYDKLDKPAGGGEQGTGKQGAGKQGTGDREQGTEKPKPDEAKPEEKKPDEKKPDEPKPEGNESSAVEGDAMSPFVAMLAKEPKPEGAGEGNQGTGNREPGSEAPKPVESKPDEPKPGEKKPEEKKPDEPKPEEKKPDEAKPDEKKPDASKPAGPSETTKRRIRNELATKKLDGLFDQVTGALARQRSASKSSAEKEPPLDIADFAAKNHMALIDTDTLTRWDVRRVELAQALTDEFVPVETSLMPGKPPLVPTRAMDLRHRYLFWKTEEKRERTPVWDGVGVRERTVARWKEVQARDRARAAAEALAQEARTAGKPLKESLGGRPGIEVLDPAPFTWMTRGSVSPLLSQAPFEINNVDGVFAPGMDFMQAVFELEPGGVAAAMNQPKTLACVVRLIKFQPADESELLWGRFQTTAPGTYAFELGQLDNQAIRASWFEMVERKAGYKTERKLDSGSQRE